MKIAILTNFSEINHGYSLTGIALDQLRMLTEYGHEAVLFVQTSFNLDTYDDPYSVRAVLPPGRLEDYARQGDLSEDHRDRFIPEISRILARELAGFDLAFTHDWVFTGWNLPYALAIRQASMRLPDLKWLHWVHSIPSGNRDWWSITEYGPAHKLIYPNVSDQLRLAEQFRGALEDLRWIPHIKDLRSFHDFHPDTCRFIGAYPAVMEADIVQLFPCGQDRLKWKRIQDVIEIFGAFKHRNRSVCLVAANQHATGRAHPEAIEDYKKLAIKAGLVPGREFIFTSDFDDRYKGAGLPKRMVRELFQCTNLFIFPTDHESFGLVAPEAALAGCFLVLNRSLKQQSEIFSHTALSFDFGSFENRVHHANRRAWLQALAPVILGRMQQNESIQTRTHTRRTYNWDAVYRNHYEPIMGEARLWGQPGNTETPSRN